MYLIEPFYGIKLIYKPIVYIMIRTLKAMHVFERNPFEF